jgi:formylglycine-generating enzyme required for sulfatase activity
MSSDDHFLPVKGAEPLPGYRLEERLGRGGFGEVWRATAPGGFGAAVKFLHVEAAAARELRSLKMLLPIRDAHLLSLQRVEELPGCVVLVMELADCTLLDRLQQCQAQGLPGIPYPELLRCFGQAADGLDFLNEPTHVLEPGGPPVGVVHGDVKPENLMLVGRGVKVADFGLSRRLSDSIAPNSTSSMTVEYSAPEVFDGKISRFTDQYALAISWCMLRGGRRPFSGNHAQVMAGHLMREPDLSMLPEAERPAVRRALSKPPRDRWPSCRDFVAALAAAGGAAPAGAEATRPAAVATTPYHVSPRVDPGVADHRSTSSPFLINPLGMRLALIPAGAFRMGSPEDEAGRSADEGPVHEVRITRPFYLSIHPVTQAQYQRLMGSNPSHFHPGRGGGPEHPVEQVSWDEAVEFCRRLSELPEERAAGRVYRLPTEAEWEYACRAGTATPFWWGASASSALANFDGEHPYGGAEKGQYLRQTARVGSYPANPWGLFDLHGNVWEWCSDWFDKGYYGQSPREDPAGPDSGSDRVLRGGSWYYFGRRCRSAFRFHSVPGCRNDSIGFRAACTAPRDP